jgi:hypothetical protein
MTARTIFIFACALSPLVLLAVVVIRQMLFNRKIRSSNWHQMVKLHKYVEERFEQSGDLRPWPPCLHCSSREYSQFEGLRFCSYCRIYFDDAGMFVRKETAKELARLGTR